MDRSRLEVRPSMRLIDPVKAGGRHRQIEVADIAQVGLLEGPGDELEVTLEVRPEVSGRVRVRLDSRHRGSSVQEVGSDQPRTGADLEDPSVPRQAAASEGPVHLLGVVGPAQAVGLRTVPVEPAGQPGGPRSDREGSSSGIPQASCRPLPVADQTLGQGGRPEGGQTARSRSVRGVRRLASESARRTGTDDRPARRAAPSVNTQAR
jgi:hypothetical protein